jgi:hypothetical protein
MAAVNEAYRVLRNPVRRAAYDAELAGARRPRVAAPEATPGRTATAASRARPETVPARYPWKLVLLMSAVGAAVVLAAAVLFEPDSTPQREDNLLGPGSCVAIEANRDAREVACTGAAGEFVVEEVVPFDEACSPGVSAYRDSQGMGWACVIRRTD